MEFSAGIFTLNSELKLKPFLGSKSIEAVWERWNGATSRRRLLDRLIPRGGDNAATRIGTS